MSSSFLKGQQWFFSNWGLIVNQPGLSFEEIRKRMLFASLIVPGVCIFFSFALHHLLHGNFIEGLLDLTAGLWLVSSLVAFRLMKKGLVVYRLNTAVLALLFLFLAVKGGVHGNKLLWVFSFPIIAFYTLGKAEGLVWTATTFLLLIGILYVPMEALRVHAYAPEFKIRFCGAFFLVSSLSYIYESVREHSQTRLMLSEERLKRAQAIAQVGNLEFDVASGMVWGSEEALRILGIATDRSVFPLAVLEQIIPDYESFHRDFETGLGMDREQDLELTIRRLSDGKAIVLQAKAELTRGAGGGVEKVVGVIQDISERKQAERERRDLEDRLVRSQKMEVLGILAGGVAHDLNNVLSSVVGYPDLLLENLPPGSPMFKPLKTIQDSGQKAAAIVQDMLALARRGVTSEKVLSLNDIVTEYLASPEHEKLAGFHPKVRFETHLDPQLLNVKGSQVHLKKVVMNLVSNAAEALPAGGLIRIRTENRYMEPPVAGFDEVREGEYVAFQVQDDGIGIAPEDLPRIFEPFYTKKKMGRSGTGLGMTVVWGIVQDHQGHLHVESSEGVGTKMDLLFPVTRESAAKQVGTIKLDEYLGKGETILVVDDVLEQRELAGNMLRKLNYQVHTAPSGEDALSFLSAQAADLVVLDMIMDPGIDGLETYIQILRSHPGQRAIIVSGFSETDRVLEAQRLGASAYVRKPYTLETLGMAARVALDCNTEPQGPQSGLGAGQSRKTHHGI